MKRLLATLALLPFLLAACDNSPPAEAPATKPVVRPATPVPAKDPAPAGFQHDPALDVFGYYFTETPVQVGNWKLRSLNLGAPGDFAAWEAGKRPETYGPVFFEFEDVSSPTAENELGQVNHTVSLRLQPDSYRVDSQAVVFHGQDPRVGEVLFSGRFDVAALRAAKTAGPAGGAPAVLTGDLQIGAERLRNISFRYFAGD